MNVNSTNAPSAAADQQRHVRLGEPGRDLLDQRTLNPFHPPQDRPAGDVAGARSTTATLPRTSTINTSAPASSDVVVVRLGDQIDVAAARDTRCAPCRAAPRATGSSRRPLAADQRAGAAQLPDGLARQRAERRRRAQPRGDADAAAMNGAATASAGPPNSVQDRAGQRRRTPSPKLQKRSPNSDSQADAWF